MRGKLRIFVLGAIAGAACAFVGCAEGEGNKNASGFSFSGVKQLYLKAGEANDEALLQGVEVLLPDGSVAKPVLADTKVDYSKAGEYPVTYEYDGRQAKTVAYVYELPQVYLQGEVVSSDIVECTYREADRSYNFIKGVQIKDSFGTVLDMKTTEDSEDFGGKLGDYKVTYTATDAAGNVLKKSIVYRVGSDKMPVVSDYEYEVGGSAEVPFDSCGADYVWLYEGESPVSTENYTLTRGSLNFSERYLLSLGLGTHEFFVKTTEGYASFSLTAEDNGKPAFEMAGVKKEYSFGTILIDYPEQLWLAHGAYAYEYSVVSKSGEKLIAEEKENGVLLLNADGNDLDGGNYELKVTAVSADMKQSTEKAYSFAVAGKADPVFMAGEKSSFGKTSFNGEEAYLWTKNAGSSAWEGRLNFKLPAGRYLALTFDMYVQSSTVASADKKANLGLCGQIGYTQDDLAANYNYREIDAEKGVFDIAAGKFVGRDDIETGKWYTVLFKTDRCVKNLGANIYLGAINENFSGAEIYLKNIVFHEKGNADILKTGKAEFTPALVQIGDSKLTAVYEYVNHGYGLWDSRIETLYQKTERAQLSFDMYVAESSLASGTKANIGLEVHARKNGADLNLLLNQDFSFVSQTTGKYTANSEVRLGEWYTVTVPTSILNEANGGPIYFYFQSGEIKTYFKNFRYEGKISYGQKITAATENGRAGFKTADVSQISAIGAKKAWEYNKSASAIAWGSRLEFLSDAKYNTLTFDLFIAETTAAANGKANVSIAGCVGSDYKRFTKIVEKETGNEVSADEMQIGKSYTVTYSLSGLAQGTRCYIYFDYTGKNVGVRAYLSNFDYS